MTLQEEIDAIIYPPSHTYQLKGLIPGEILKERLEIIEREFPNFFMSGALLDVGCNKGFFSLYHKGHVTGIDPDEACITLCKKLLPSGYFLQTTFGGLHTDAKFDRIFIGNGHHYPFIEFEGWGFVEKLAEMSCGLVLLEGPVDMKGVDAKRCIPKHLTGSFTFAMLLSTFSPAFHFRYMVRSSLVKRHFLLFERKK